jgi:glycosyltransferase involved in cell wall biosynthesis
MSSAIQEELISIALCTYNGARYLPQQLDSLLVQTYRNIEIVAADDGSSDETVAILRDYARRDSRLRVLASDVNRGVTGNFEFALSQCQGAYIAPCDQDDIWLAEKLSVLKSSMGAAALSYCDSELIDSHGHPLGMRISDRELMPSTQDPAVFALGNCIAGHAMLFRRTLLPQALPTPQGFLYDWWIVAVATTNGGIAYCPRVLVQYRQHGANVTDLLRFRTPTNSPRPAGFRSMRIRDTGKRIAALATLPGESKDLFNQLQQLWTLYESRWFSFSLAWFMLLNRKRLLALQRLSGFRACRKCAGYIWGLRLKRFVNGHAYGP